MLVKGSLKKLRSSPIKVNNIMKLIRGKRAMDALNLLKTCRKRVAEDIRKLLYSVVSNAENNFALDIDSLKVHEAYVGKSMMLKRLSCRAKGRGNTIVKSFSHIYITLSKE